MARHVVVIEKLGHRDGQKCHLVAMPPLVPCRHSIKPGASSELVYPLLQGRYNCPELTRQMEPTCYPQADKVYNLE